MRANNLATILGAEVTSVSDAPIAPLGETAFAAGRLVKHGKASIALNAGDKAYMTEATVPVANPVLVGNDSFKVDGAGVSENALSGAILIINGKSYEVLSNSASAGSTPTVTIVVSGAITAADLATGIAQNTQFLTNTFSGTAIGDGYVAVSTIGAGQYGYFLKADV